MLLQLPALEQGAINYSLVAPAERREAERLQLIQARSNLQQEGRPCFRVVEDFVTLANKRVDVRLQALDTASQMYNEALQQINQHLTSQTTDTIQAEVAEARAEYGADLDNYAEQIIGMTKLPNPVTGRRFTGKESYELITGKAHQKATEMASREADIRGDAAAKAGSPPALGVVASDEGGEMSDEQLLREMEKLDR